MLSPLFITRGRMGARRAALILMKIPHFDRTPVNRIQAAALVTIPTRFCQRRHRVICVKKAITEKTVYGLSPIITICYCHFPRRKSLLEKKRHTKVAAASHMREQVCAFPCKKSQKRSHISKQLFSHGRKWRINKPSEWKIATSL